MLQSCSTSFDSVGVEYGEYFPGDAQILLGLDPKDVVYHIH